ncbi:hypothetical protein SAMN05660462_01702 [Proteiniborus ethanoligenes]|uniref:Uncharacterized protein n=1 Tax=Proteiniborus ethanoligenes TaxID=415015 RepID=A0A1H3PXY7_9FIRM|nr:DUF5685 family protein [Proteiniborus ethanoligenes]TAH62887.1 MAG: hypothetical protein EWM50_04600 [Gottschalkiaceae bacterium]SDZ06164.1 hypothetical protein SAMN05660462_01702 [Proteiniborus ethanoligenes]
MFGYIIPYKSELKVREYDMFKAYYCGLCKTLGKKFNQIVRLGLNYDLTFLALVLSSIDENKEKITREGCIANPFKKKYIVNTNRALLYASNMSIILTYHKLQDDWKDEGAIKSLIGTIPYLSPLSKANKTFGRKAESIREYLNKLIMLEKSKCNKVDEIADIFGKLMEEISVPDYIENKKIERSLKWIGYNLGRWIYILDAFDDLESDIINNSYNPILLQYKYGKDEEIGDFKKRILESIEFSLIMSLESIGKGIEVLDIRKNRGIIENIVYMGSRDRMEAILKKGGCFHEKSI